MPNTTEAEVYLVNLDTNEKLPIMFIPDNMDWNAKSNWATIPTIARNNPFYHYTGGEDKLSFQLDWYAGDKGRTAAINAANKVKSWGRNDGYVSKPPRILLVWGELFKNHTWIVAKAEYKMSLFDRTHGMMPVQVYQQLELRKVTDHNETQEEIADQYDSKYFAALLRKFFDPRKARWVYELTRSKTIYIKK